MSSVDALVLSFIDMFTFSNQELNTLLSKIQSYPSTYEIM